MKASIRLYKSDGKSKRGYPIKLILHHNGKERKKTIGHSDLDDWNIKSELPLTNHFDFDDLYPKILNIKSRIKKSKFSEIHDFDNAFAYALNIEEVKVIDFYDFAQSQIDYMHKLGRHGNADAYKSAINELKSFEPELNFKDIDSYLIERFKKHKKLKCKNSTIRTYIAEIKAIYNTCLRTNKVENKHPFDGAFKDLPVPKRRVKNIYINIDGVNLLENANIDHPSIQRSVDITLLQFYLGGQDLIDIYYLKKEQIYKDRVFFQRTKLGALKYEFDVKLFNKAKTIIDKYKGGNDDYLFGWRKDLKGYKTFRNNHNRDLENAFKRLKIEVLPRPDKFTSKSIRHTFATIAKFKFIDVDIIRELQGHERSDIDTMYKDKFPEQVRDEAHFKIISSL